MVKMTISKSSKIEENTAVYVVNGNWAGYIVRDCVTGDLLLVIPIPHLKSNDVRTFEQGSTYEELFPNNVIRIHNTEEKAFSNPSVMFWSLLIGLFLGVVTVVRFLSSWGETGFDKFLACSSLVLIIVPFVLGPIWLSATLRPVSSNEWVEIYQNDLAATVELEYQDYKEYYHSAFAGTHDESLKDLSDTVIRKQAIRNIKLTVKKDHEEIQKIVVLDKDNLIQKYDDLNNVKISKVEYRKIDGLSRVLFGIYGNPQTFDEIGEIRITLESSEDKELQKVFGQ